ncbi:MULTISPECIES: HAD family hydrolase [Streptomyces]|uniref:HAD family hydrolase n=1 Tax=Streptomyces TaxID=1883 RepID=UPI0017B57969|nr:HAD family phosphatase [Streptomyces murinus]MBA9050637.1 beta-phosphoglucomutase-like phosphatase (HAD superfamily) [Streptomyces murinus]
MTARHLRLVAVNVDGVLLNDTFSPVIHRFVVGRGGRYTAELERALFSQPQRTAAAAAAAGCGWQASPEELLAAYFAEREAYLRDHPVRVLDGAQRLLARLRDLGVTVVCYGGLDRSHFDRHLGGLAGYFDAPGYVCTDGFRPGVKEITRDIVGVRFDQALFIDDVARVAETARSLGAAFIGHPSPFAHGFQAEAMRRAGVRHVVRSLDAIDERLLHALDAEAAAVHRAGPGAGGTGAGFDHPVTGG